MDRRFLPSDDVFFLRIKGESMVGRGIFEDDYVLVSPSTRAKDGDIVAAFMGYTGEVSEDELKKAVDSADYKAGQQIGKQGLEKQYEPVLRGKEGSQFVEIDARGRIVRQTGARPDLTPFQLKTVLHLTSKNVRSDDA